MEPAELEAIEARLRKAVLKAGALAGVCAVGTLLALGILFGVAAWGYRQYKAEAQAKRAAEGAAAAMAVRPAFAAAAREAEGLIEAEHRDAPFSWKAYKADREKAEDTLKKLEASAATSHEFGIALALSEAESGFSICAGYSDRPDPFPTPVSQCEKQNPVGDAKKALLQ